MTQKRKRGRPQLAESERKSFELSVRFTKDEMNKLQYLSSTLNVSKGEVMRGLLAVIKTNEEL